jgi:hypothetical protein
VEENKKLGLPAVALTDIEASAVEGDGWLFGLLIAIAFVTAVVVEAILVDYTAIMPTVGTGIGTAGAAWVNSDLP